MKFLTFREFVREAGIVAEKSEFFDVFHNPVSPDTVIDRLKLVWTNDQLVREIDFGPSILRIGKNVLTVRPFIVSDIYSEFAASLELSDKPSLETKLFDDEEKRAIQLYLIYFISYYVYYAKLHVDTDYLKNLISTKYPFTRSHMVINCFMLIRINKD